MTNLQQEFYKLIRKQMVDYNEDFHEEFTIQRIEQISDENLKVLLDNIHTDKDNVVKKKGYITYAKFIYYANKMIDDNLNTQIPNKQSRIDTLYNKRELILQTIQNEAPTIQKRNELIQNIQDKVLMFKENDKNILDDIDYFIIEQFGFYNFFDENKNYMIKEEIAQHLKQYTSKQLLLQNNQQKLLGD